MPNVESGCRSPEESISLNSDHQVYAKVNAIEGDAGLRRG